VIKNLLKAIGSDDLPAVEEMLAEGVRLEIPGTDELPFIRKAKGREQMIEAIKQNFGALQNQRPSIEAVIAQGDTVIVIMEEEGEIRASGKKYQTKGMQRFVIREGKVELVEELFVPL